MDVDQDGTISLSEYIEHMQRVIMGGNGNFTSELFSSFEDYFYR